MARNGSGTFTRNNGTFTGSSVWANDRDAGTKITAGNHDTHDQDIADAITASIAKDGQTPITANLPMSGYAHTNVAEGTSRNQYAAISQVQDGELNYISLSGSSNTFTGNASPAITAYQAGQLFLFKANHTITGAATINLNSLGAKNLLIAFPTTMRSSAENDVVANMPFLAYYDGTSFVMVHQPPRTYKAATPTYSANFTSPTTTVYRWSRSGRQIHVLAAASGTVTGTANSITVSVPVASESASYFTPVLIQVSGASAAVLGWGLVSGSTLSIKQDDSSNFPTGTTSFWVNFTYEED
jgi:hypothetical protein